MSDLGGDSGQATLNLFAKAMEAILRLLEKIMQAYMDKGKRELTQEQLNELKEARGQREALQELNGKSGYVQEELMRKSGQPMQTFGLYMTDSEMRAFAEQCKREGIAITGVVDSKSLAEKGEAQFEIMCFSKDLQSVLKVVERNTDEARLKSLNEAEAKLLAKGEDMTDADRQLLKEVQAEKEAIQRKYCTELNQNTANNVVEKAVTGEVRKPMTLDEALNHHTGGELDKKFGFSVVADAQDPNKYITCRGETDTYHDKPYTKTTYEVHRGEDVLLKTDDGKFDGRPQDYWQQQKTAMQEAGQFSGTFLKFYSMDEFKDWQREATKQNEQELSNTAVSELKQQLDERGAKMVDGIVCDKETNEPIALKDGMSEEERASVAETLVIGKQIEACEKLESLEDEMVQAQAEMMMAEEGTPEFADAKAKVDELETEIDAVKSTQQELVDSRKEINAVQSEQVVREQTEERTYLPEDKAKIDELETKLDTEQTKLDTLLADYQEAALSGDSGRAGMLMAEIETQNNTVGEVSDELTQLKTDSAVRGQAEQSEHSRAVEAEKYLPEDKEKISALESKIEEYSSDTPPVRMAEVMRSDGTTATVPVKEDVQELKQALAKLKEEATERYAASIEKQDERRSDRVDEHDERQQTMAEYKGQIAQKREEAAKAADVADRNAHNISGKAAVEKTSKPHER